MNTLTIFYDQTCGLCGNFRRWLLSQQSYLPLEFLDYQSEAARIRFPLIAELNAGNEIIVLADDGRWWQGPPAWLTCLWALRDYREWSFRLATPKLMPIVERLCHLLSENRFKVSKLLRLKPDELQIVAKELTPQCGTTSCEIPAFSKLKQEKEKKG